jgi:adenylate cyclase
VRVEQLFERFPVSAPLAVGTIVFVIIAGLRQIGVFQGAELGTYDVFMRWRPPGHHESPPVVIVEVKESDIQTLKSWPLSDEVLAITLERILSLEPRAIGLDIYRDLPVPPGRERLAQVLRKDQRIVGVYQFPGIQEGVAAPAAIRDTSQVGFNDVIVDPGGIVRRGLLFMSDSRRRSDGSFETFTGYSFALRLALRYLEKDQIFPTPDSANPEYLRIGNTTFRPLEAYDGSYIGMDARGYQFLFDYRDDLENLPRYSFMEFLSGNVNSAHFKDRVVLVGSVAGSVPDLFYTPFSAGLTANQQIPGVTVHAHAVAQLIRFAKGQSAPVGFGSGGVELFWLFIWSVAGAIAGRRVRSLLRITIVGACGAALLVATTFVGFAYGWWIPVVPPLLAWFISGAIITAYLANQELKQRRMLMNLFARHVDPTLADAIWEQRDKFLRGGRPSSTKLTATVMFTDLHGFVHVAEELTPGDLMDWLNDYMEAMMPLVMQRGGVVIRFIGDAIMAAFGLPLARTSEAEIRQDAENAVRCALAMERRLIELNHHLRKRDLPLLGMRVGIYTGSMVGGSIGDSHRLEYNVHGDSVNTAARLEAYDKKSFTPEYATNPCRILIGDTTRAYLDESFSTMDVGEISLRGKDRPVIVYRVSGESTATSPDGE